jgi:L-fuculose-phosphate aldolase
MTLNEAKKEIVKYAKKMYACGMVNIFEGNISMRLSDRFIITPSQQSKEDMTEEMIIEIDGNGTVLNPSDKYKPSSEVKMHFEVYRVRPDVNAVVHNHSAYATSYAVAGQPIKTRALTEALAVFGEVPVASYGTPGTDRIYADFARLLPTNNAILLANHGVLAVAPDILHAYSIAEAVEKLAQTLLLAKLIGGECPLPNGEDEQIIAYGLKKRKAAIEAAMPKT